MGKKKLTRRDFIKNGCKWGLGLSLSPLAGDILLSAPALAKIGERRGLHEAMWYDSIDETTVQCKLCPRGCTLSNGQRSFCRVREPYQGKLYTLVYELPCSLAIDPIEKKPLFHMLPGSKAFSLATAGCNLRCKFCQNWAISQRSPEQTRNVKFSCKEVVNRASRMGCSSIAYTYNEPTIFYEYALDIQKLAKKKGIRGIYVTNGYMNSEPIKELAKYVEAANIDLKGFDEKYLKEVCAQELKPLLTAIKAYKKNGVWIELTNLVVPTLNDKEKMVEDMCKWIVRELGRDVPLHFSRFQPQYKLEHLPPTPVKTLDKMINIARSSGIKFVYIGNVPGHKGNSTYCPNCRKVLIQRTGYILKNNNLRDGKCKFCGVSIPGIWK